MLGGERAKLQVAISSCTQRDSCCGPIPCRPMRCCLMRMCMDSGFLVACLRGIYDNMRTAVDRVGRGKSVKSMPASWRWPATMCSSPSSAIRAAGWEKGQVEKNVQDSRHRLWQPMPEFPDLAALNVWLERRCQGVVARDPARRLAWQRGRCLGRRTGNLDAVTACLRRFCRTQQTCSPTCLISFERNRYSVPASFANRPVSLRVYPDRLVVAAEGSILCEHVRVIQRSHVPPQTIYDWRTIWLSFSASPGHCAMGRPSWNYRQHSGSLDLHRFCSGHVLMLGGPLFEGHW